MKTALCGTPVTENAYNEHVVSCPTCRANYVNNINNDDNSSVSVPMICCGGVGEHANGCAVHSEKEII